MNHTQIGIQPSQPHRDSSEIEVQLNELECAKTRLSLVLTQFAGRLSQGGVLIPQGPEAENKSCAEVSPNSPLGERIRGVRSDLHGIAADFERLLDRMAI